MFSGKYHVNIRLDCCPRRNSSQHPGPGAADMLFLQAAAFSPPTGHLGISCSFGYPWSVPYATEVNVVTTLMSLQWPADTQVDRGSVRAHSATPSDLWPCIPTLKVYYVPVDDRRVERFVLFLKVDHGTSRLAPYSLHLIWLVCFPSREWYCIIF